MTVILIGLEQVTRHLRNLSEGLRDLNHMRSAIGTPELYAESVHEGSRAHDIRPRNKKALFWPGAGHPVRGVHHPGNDPNPFLRVVFEARRPSIINGIASGLEDAIRNGELHAAAGLASAMDKTLELAQEQSPVGRDREDGHKGGTLRDSLHTDFRSR